ncbi:hypothetical protein N185_15740 [Sinorhizobium sp. GW3]|nr:hypothetical protein N185_15740 [Sinorhizobium sp. GW3]
MEDDIFITNAIVVTCDERNRVIQNGGIIVNNGMIRAVGSTDQILAAVPSQMHHIDGAGCILMPGLINTHSHAADTLFRGLVENLPLEPWLQKVWKAEAAILNPQTSYLGSMIGFAELLLSGVTTVMDMCWYPSEAVRAAGDLGLRIATGGILFDYPGVTGQSVDERFAAAERFFDEVANNDHVFPAIMPHGAYTVSPQNLQIGHKISRGRNALYSIHAAETLAEQLDIKRRYGRSIIRHLQHLDVLDERTSLAHCVHLDDEEIRIIAQSGATVLHNPLSNLKLASGVARVPDMLDAGIPVALGTDGAVSGNDLDMWLAVRLAATLHKGVTKNAGAVSTTQALTMATRTGAHAVGAGGKLGSLEPGKLADMILVSLDRPHAVPLFDPVTHLVYSTAKSDVRDVFVDGKQVVRNGTLVQASISHILAEVRKLAPRIAASLN